MKKFNVTCTVIYCVELPCQTAEEARDILRRGRVDLAADALDSTNATMEGGIDLDDIEEAS